tara:strand:+ start:491 stop:616 length:126 start_codon:yes stop_codon:yes gene_type:complete
MEALTPEVYDALLEIYEDYDYRLLIDYRNYTSTFELVEVES